MYPTWVSPDYLKVGLILKFEVAKSNFDTQCVIRTVESTPIFDPFTGCLSNVSSSPLDDCLRQKKDLLEF